MAWGAKCNPTMCGEGGAVRVERIQLVLDTAHCYNMRQRVSEMENAKRWQKVASERDDDGESGWGWRVAD